MIMPDLDPILDTLWHDVQMLIGAIVVMGVWWLIPAAMVGFVAAARTEPTRWCDLPMGIFWGWLGGIAGGIAAFLVLVGMREITELGRGWRPPYVDSLWGGMFIGGAIIAIVTNYQSSVWYYRRKIQQLHGWKLDDPPPRSANHRYSFTLRRLLIAQFVTLFVFAMWVGARRDYIQRQYQYRREAAERQAQRESLKTRFEVVGWDVWICPDERLNLAQHATPTLTNFDDKKLERLQPADRLLRITIRSDSLTDEGLEILGRQAELEELEIQSNQVTDAGIAHLHKLPLLKKVHLTCPKLTTKTLDELQAMESLRYVVIYQSSISYQRANEFEHSRPGVKIFVLKSALQ